MSGDTFDTVCKAIAVALLLAPIVAAGFFGVIVGFLASRALARRRLHVCPGCAEVAGKYPVCRTCLDRLHGRGRT